jgi:protein-tyrosine-phosphatase
MRVLFVCTGNSCRSPMAERLARKLFPDHQFESAGVTPEHWMHPVAERVLVEREADPNGFECRDVLDLDLGGFDYLVLIGRTAQALAPRPPDGPAIVLWDVADPYEAKGSEEDILQAYRSCASELVQLICRFNER